ncbi:MAG: ATP-binding protein, partial [Oscillospiraceae bacterium]
YIENYLSIKKIIFGERLQYEINCDEKIKSFKIPFFSLQPFVENSMEHGILNKEDGGTVKIICSKLPHSVLLVISDNGIGIEQTQLKYIEENILTNLKKPPEKHVGMFNCYNRYKVAFDEKADIKIESAVQKGTKITVEILTDVI